MTMQTVEVFQMPAGKRADAYELEEYTGTSSEERRNYRRNPRALVPFGQYLNDRLDSFGKTTSDLRRLTDFSPTAFTAWKYGEKIPQPESLWRIAEAFAEMEGARDDKARIEQLYSTMMRIAGRGDHLISSTDLAVVPDDLARETSFAELVNELRSFDERLRPLAIRTCLQALQSLSTLRRDLVRD